MNFAFWDLIRLVLMRGRKRLPAAQHKALFAVASDAATGYRLGFLLRWRRRWRQMQGVHEMKLRRRGYLMFSLPVTNIDVDVVLSEKGKKYVAYWSGK